MKSKWILAALVVLVGGALYAGTVLASSQATATATSLATKIAFGEIDINDHAVPADTWQARVKGAVRKTPEPEPAGCAQ